MLPTRRFGRSELAMPVLSLGGMRFQQSWSDLAPDQITAASQANLRATLSAAVAHGFHHVETARHYGSSERQLGWLLPQVPDAERILQTKVPPQEDPAAFEAELALSFERLAVDRVDCLAIHGINLSEHLQATLKPGGCMEVARRWQRERGNSQSESTTAAGGASNSRETRRARVTTAVRPDAVAPDGAHAGQNPYGEGMLMPKPQRIGSAALER